MFSRIHCAEVVRVHTDTALIINSCSDRSSFRQGIVAFSSPPKGLGDTLMALNGDFSVPLPDTALYSVMYIGRSGSLSTVENNDSVPDTELLRMSKAASSNR